MVKRVPRAAPTADPSPLSNGEAKPIPCTIQECKRQLEELTPFVHSLAQEIAADSLAALEGDRAAQQAIHEADRLRKELLLRQEMLEAALRTLQQQGRDARHPFSRQGSIGPIQTLRNGRARPLVEDRFNRLLPRLQGHYREQVLDYRRDKEEVAHEAVTIYLLPEPRLIWHSGGKQPTHDEQTAHDHVLSEWRYQVNYWADALVTNTPLPTERQIEATRLREHEQQQQRKEYQDSISRDIHKQQVDATNRRRARSGPLG